MVRYHEIIKEDPDMPLVEQYFIIKGDYTVNSDNTIDVTGKCIANRQQHTETLPFTFNIATEEFNCCHMGLTSLKGSPRSTRNFYCAKNKITTLEYGPNIVSKYYDCGDNFALTSLKGAPTSVENFYCASTNISSLEYGPSVVTGKYECGGNPKLVSLKGAPAEVREFHCNHTGITSFEGCPAIINGNCDMSNNFKLTSFKGLPNLIKGRLDLSHCETLTDLPLFELLERVEDGVHIEYGPNLPLLKLLSDKYNIRDTLVHINFHKGPASEKAGSIIEKHLGNPNIKRRIYDCQYELIKAGFKGNARW